MIVVTQLLIAALLAGLAAFGITSLVRAKQDEAMRRRIAEELEAASKVRAAAIRESKMPASVEEFLNAPLPSPRSDPNANKPN